MKTEKDPKRVAAGKRSSRKGKSRERNLALLLSNWWTGGKDSKAFRRTPLSGAWPQKRSHGDILPVTAEAETLNFVIEIKDRKEVEDVDFADLLLNERCPIFLWWDELNNLVHEFRQNQGKMRMLIVHKRRKDYVIFGKKEICFIKDNAGPIAYLHIHHRFRWEELYVVTLKDLFDKIPETLGFLKEGSKNVVDEQVRDGAGPEGLLREGNPLPQSPAKADS